MNPYASPQITKIDHKAPDTNYRPVHSIWIIMNTASFGASVASLVVTVYCESGVTVSAAVVGLTAWLLGHVLWLDFRYKRQEEQKWLAENGGHWIWSFWE